MNPNTLYYGDCLEWMRKWPGESVDLVYLDPPFNSKATYNVLYGIENGKPAQVEAFEDTWLWTAEAKERVDSIRGAGAHRAHDSIRGLYSILGGSGMMSYLSYMADRLNEIWRLLRQTGCVYLHCDPKASHYLKVVMDDIFEPKNFRNDCIWPYRTGGVSKKRWPRKHQNLLFYTKEKRYYKHTPPPKQRVYYDSPFFTDKIDEQGRYYADVHVRNVWDDIKPLINTSSERLGYPTQKPVVLLERVIKASSNPDDLVLDPFCGCGTTVEAAYKLGRRFIGIDISSFAVDLIRTRRFKGIDISTEGLPRDLAGARKLAEDNKLDFEKWAITRIKGFRPNRTQTGDKGIDGRARLAYWKGLKSDLAISQVKSRNPSASEVRDFCGVVRREDAVLGVFITLDKVSKRRRGVYEEIGDMGKVNVGGVSYPRVQFWSMEEYFKGGGGESSYAQRPLHWESHR